jgi:hypothetical protein
MKCNDFQSGEGWVRKAIHYDASMKVQSAAARAMKQFSNSKITLA